MINEFDRTYHEMLQHILDNGVERKDRTGTGTIGVFGYQNRYDISEKFPLLTTKKVLWRAVLHELLWFLQGRNGELGWGVSTDYLTENNVHIWDEWAKPKVGLYLNPETDKYERHTEKNQLGPVYGAQWRAWSGEQGKETDQIAEVIKSIKENPWSRRHIVSAWNVNDIDAMALPPCHLLFQFNVRPDKNGEPYWLDCQLYQRSADVFLGVPFNIASYSALTYMIAHLTGLKPGEFIHTFGDLHIYSNHVEQVKEQLERESKEAPTLRILDDGSIKTIDDFKFDNLLIEGYDPHPFIKAPIAV